mmetsp:Transcript_28813/g.93707  ORF Transcript_28813/g.93707 Transcript_28813/m.93707 type:complete len:270 (+) Transcript_28813:1317-2126(+)
MAAAPDCEDIADSTDRVRLPFAREAPAAESAVEEAAAAAAASACCSSSCCCADAKRAADAACIVCDLPVGAAKVLLGSPRTRRPRDMAATRGMLGADSVLAGLEDRTDRVSTLAARSTARVAGKPEEEAHGEEEEDGPAPACGGGGSGGGGVDGSGGGWATPDRTAPMTVAGVPGAGMEVGVPSGVGARPADAAACTAIGGRGGGGGPGGSGGCLSSFIVRTNGPPRGWSPCGCIWARTGCWGSSSWDGKPCIPCAASPGSGGRGPWSA